MTTDKKLSVLLPQQIPDYVGEFYPLFVTFVTKYFEWLEEPGNAQETIQNLVLNRDIDTTASSLATKFMSTYAPGMPLESAADRSILVKYFRDFYDRKGSEESFKFFFRAFFNDQINVQRPADFLFKTSDGSWYVERSLRVTAVTGDPRGVASTTSTGSSTGATAAVNQVDQITDDAGVAYNIILQTRGSTGTFSSSEFITATAWDWVNNTSSQVVMLNTAPVRVANGRWLDTKSQVSDGQVLQDSFYYQNFSYVIQSHISLSEWYTSILEQLHPTGNAVFNNMVIDTDVDNTVSGFATTVVAETVVDIPIGIPTFYIGPGYTFDRVADFFTGTSATTSAGAIVYDDTYIYAGENVTWALQAEPDAIVYGTARATITTGGPSMDKIEAGVAVDDSLITQGNQVNFSSITELYHSSSILALVSGTVIRTTSISVANSLSSIALLVTWMKDFTGNASEVNNQLEITVSSAGLFTAVFDAELQRNYKDIGIRRTQLYAGAAYLNSSNAVVGSIVSGDSANSVTITWTPTNILRAGAYSRCSLRIDAPVNTSLTITVAVAGGTGTWNATATDFLNATVIGA